MRASWRAREEEVCLVMDERFEPMDEGPSAVRSPGTGESFLIDGLDKICLPCCCDMVV